MRLSVYLQIFDETTPSHALIACTTNDKKGTKDTIATCCRLTIESPATTARRTYPEAWGLVALRILVVHRTESAPSSLQENV